MPSHSLLAAAGVAAVWQHAHSAEAPDLALTREFVAPPPPKINCGGHFAETCHVCPADWGEAWCHGECMWVMDSCRPDTPMNHMRMHVSNALHMWFMWLPLLLVTVAVQIIYAAAFKIKVVAKYPQDIGMAEVEGSECGEFRERESGIFSMFQDKSTALWACFCTPVLAAKNFHVGNVLGYWPSCLVIGCTMYSPLFLVAAVIRTLLSQKLKQNLNLQPSFCKDFLLSLFCFHCEVGRESLEVDEAEFIELSCPFNVESSFVEPAKVVEEEPEVDDAPQQEEPTSRNCATMMGSGKMRVCTSPFSGGETVEDSEVKDKSAWFWQSTPAEPVEEPEQQASEGQEQSSWFTWRSAPAEPAEEAEQLLSPEQKEDEPAEAVPETDQQKDAELEGASGSWFWRTTPVAQTPKGEAE